MNREILGGGWRDEVFERVLEMRVVMRQSMIQLNDRK
jgi:hypothetical protein